MQLPSWWRDRGARMGVAGLVLLATVGVGAPFFAPYSPRAQDRTGFHRPPSLPGEGCSTRWLARDERGNTHLFGFEGCRAYVLGTDALGRDVLSRVLYGARVSVTAAVLGVVFTVSFGALVGAAAALGGGVWDRVLMRGTELVMALRHIEGTDVGIDSRRFRELSEYVSRASQRPLPASKPITGANLFLYEAAGRAEAMLADTTSYEIYSPESVGLERRLIIGKYSGVSSVLAKLAQHNYFLTIDEAERLLPHLQSRSIALKRALYDEEVIDIYEKARTGGKRWKR